MDKKEEKQIRNLAASAALEGLLFFNGHKDKVSYSSEVNEDFFAKRAICYADAVVNECKKLAKANGIENEISKSRKELSILGIIAALRAILSQYGDNEDVNGIVNDAFMYGSSLGMIMYRYDEKNKLIDKK